MPVYNRGKRLDPSQVEDVRGRRMGRGGGMTPIAAGGGGIGLIVLLVVILLGGDPFAGTSSPYGSLEGEQGAGSNLAQECQTGADAERREDCRIVLFVNSIQDYWTVEFTRLGGRYQMARTQFFTDATQTACGSASSQVGPFYCPLDQKVYIDLGFFEELQGRFGASGGAFAQAYVLAHEYGHHVQNLIGTLENAQDRDTGPQSAAVRVELQADCFAGLWAYHATTTGYITKLTDQDIADGLSAAAAVGDDRIQKAATGRVNPESWTHGSAEQRQSWFMRGFRGGDVPTCDTFRGSV